MTTSNGCRVLSDCWKASDVTSLGIPSSCGTVQPQSYELGVTLTVPVTKYHILENTNA